MRGVRSEIIAGCVVRPKDQINCTLSPLVARFSKILENNRRYSSVLCCIHLSLVFSIVLLVLIFNNNNFTDIL